MNRIARLLLALAIALGWELSPPAAQPVAAACTTGSCATIEVSFYAGTGEGLVSTFPGGIDCLWSAPVKSGTCVSQFDVPGGGLLVTFYLDPGVHSMACWNQICGSLEQRITREVTIYPGEYRLVQNALFNLGNKTHVTIDTKNTSGSGTTTSSPAGISCTWNGSVKSGTCAADFWYSTQNLIIQLTLTPSGPGMFACRDINNCGEPGAAFTFGVNLSPGGSNPPALYYPAKPVTVEVIGPGSLVSSPAGIWCPGICSAWFKPGTNLVLTANPPPGGIADWHYDCADIPVSQKYCPLTLSYFGAKAGVQFVAPATPQPTITPRPSVTPRPTVPPTAKPSSPATTPAPGHTGAPPSAPSSAPPSTAGASSPAPGSTTLAGSPGPGSSPIVGSSPDPAIASPGHTGEPAGQTPGSPIETMGAPVGTTDVAGGPSDPNAVLLLLVVVLALVLGLVLGGLLVYALRRRDRRTEAAGPG